jgi:acyl dehydratase
MPILSSYVGTSAEPVIHHIDERWLMSYAAGLGDTLPCYLDTLRSGGIVAHPLFPVCVEWPAILGMRQNAALSGLADDEMIRAVHASHDLNICRGIRPGDRLTTRATVAGVEMRRSGAFQVTRLDTTDAAGDPVCTTWQGSFFLGVGVAGADHPAVGAPPTPEAADVIAARAEASISVSALAAHVYTECARIWNPIHTDIAVAVRAGLPGTILHGTATLALAVSRILALEADNDPERVKRVAGRFGAMVPMPSTITVRVLSRQRTAAEDIVRFEVRNSEGTLAVQNGWITLNL